MNPTQQPHPLGFAIDIDGVLVKSHTEVQGASEALNLITAHKIPYILVTNNIAKTEQHKADQLNSLLRLDLPIRGEQIVLNITPLRKYKDWHNQTILIIIRENEAPQRLPLQGMERFVTIEEYVSMFPECVPLSRRVLDERAWDIRKRVAQRLGIDL